MEDEGQLLVFECSYEAFVKQRFRSEQLKDGESWLIS